MTKNILLPVIAGAVGIIIGLFGNAVCGYIPSLSVSFGTRSNGFAWYRYGPALISSSSCKIAIVSFDGIQRIEVNDEKKIDEIKEWVAANRLVERYDSSPNIPYTPYSSQIHVYPFVQLFSSDDTLKPDSLLMEIPINTLTMGMNQHNCDEKIETLRKIVQPE